MNKIVVSITVAILAVATMLFVAQHVLPPIASDSWIINTGSKIATSKAFPNEYGGVTVSNSSVYISLENGMLYRLNHNGDTLWSFPMQNYSIYPPVEDGETTYVTSFDGRLYALNTNSGKEQWRFTTPNLIMADTEPVISGSFVMFGSRNGTLYALDKHTGKISWTFQTTPIDAAHIAFDEPIIHFGRFTTNQTTVYVNSATGNSLYALDLSTGATTWTLKNYGFFYQKPILKGDVVSLQNNKGLLLTINSKTGHIVSETAYQPVQTDNPKYKDATLDAQSSRRLGGAVYTLTKDQANLIKLNRQQTDTAVSTLKKKTLGNKPYISKKTNRPQEITIRPQKEKATNNTVYTLTIVHDDSGYINPQKDFIIQGVFTSPKKMQYTVNGFYYDHNTWQIRFTPNQIGTWRWSVGEQRGSFEVIDSTHQEFMRISPTQPKIFMTGNDFFIPLGLQDCIQDYNQNGDPLDQWFPGMLPEPSENKKTFNAYPMETYMSLYQQTGFNLWRYGVENCSKKLWLEISRTGNRYSLNEGLRVDQLFDSLKFHNYHIWMSLFSFKLPYENTLSAKDKQIILKDYLDYIIARYTAYVDVWELANEIRLDDETIAFMASYIRSIDPHKHPITTNWERANHNAIEINSVHWYDTVCDLYCARNVEIQIEKYKNLQKPTVFSELGNRDANWDPYSADRMRVKLWIGFFYNIMPIYWNSALSLYSSAHGASNIYLGPIERTYIKNFSGTVATVQNGQQIKVTTTTRGITTLGKKSNTNTIVYLYRNIVTSTKSTAEILLPEANIRSLQWIDPKTGTIIGTPVSGSHGQAITTPPFTTDLLLKASYN